MVFEIRVGEGRDAGLLAEFGRQTFIDAFAGQIARSNLTAFAEKRFGERASGSLQLGYRDENNAGGSDKLHLWHLDIDAAARLSDDLALTAKWNHRSETKVAFPRSTSLAVAFPTRSASPSTSRMSSVIWNTRPIFLP